MLCKCLTYIRRAQQGSSVHVLRQDGKEPVQVTAAAPAGDKKPQKGRTGGEDAEGLLDTDWLAEHASQVSKLLPGGTRARLCLHCTLQHS